MKTSIRKKNNRSSWKTKSISLTCLFLPILLSLSVGSISMSTKSAVAAPNCSAIERSLNELKKELKEGDDLGVRERKELIQRIAAKRKELDRCNKPAPPTQAKLEIQQVWETIDNSTSTRKYRAVIVNNSSVPTTGSFSVTTGVTHYNSAGGEQTTEVRDNARNITIAPGQTYVAKGNSAPNTLNASYKVEILVEYQGKLSTFTKTYR
jgi:hypothetical protein